MLQIVRKSRSVTYPWVASFRGPPPSEDKRDEGTGADGDCELCVDSATVSVAQSTQTHWARPLGRLSHGFGSPVDPDEHHAAAQPTAASRPALPPNQPVFTSAVAGSWNWRPSETPTDVADRAQSVGTFFELLGTSWVSHALYAAAVLEVPDALRDEPLPAAAVADTVGADAVAVERLLRALVTIGLVEQGSGGGYALTPLGSLLRSDTDASLRNPVLLGGSPGSMRAWAQLAECIRSGSTAAKLLDGVDEPFAPTAKDSPEQRVFDSAMAESTRHMADAIARTYDFSGINTIVDVGGGYGALLLPILHEYPRMRGVVFDRPHCRAGAEELLDAAGLTDRCTFAGGDFFRDDYPAADAYVLKSVIHDWDDEGSIRLVRRCRAHMAPDTRLLIVEVVVPDRLEQTTAHRRIVWADLRMLVSTGGRERTYEDYERLLEQAGLWLAGVTPTGAALDVIEAVAA